MKKKLNIIIALTIACISSSAYAWFMPALTNIANRLSNVIIGSHRQPTIHDKLSDMQATLENNPQEKGLDVRMYRLSGCVQGAIHDVSVSESEEKKIAMHARQVLLSKKAQSLQESWQAEDFKKGLQAKLIEKNSLRAEKVNEFMRDCELVNKGTVADTCKQLEVPNKTFVKKAAVHQDVEGKSNHQSANEWVIVKNPRIQQVRKQFDNSPKTRLQEQILYNKMQDFVFIPSSASEAA